MLLRYVDGSDAFGYHPLLREFLRPSAGVRSAATTSGGACTQRSPRRSRPGPTRSARSSTGSPPSGGTRRSTRSRARARCCCAPRPVLLARWISALPTEVQELPTIRMLEGQLEWGAGQHARAVPPLQAAVAGYRAAGGRRGRMAGALLLRPGRVLGRPVRGHAQARRRLGRARGPGHPRRRGRGCLVQGPRVDGARSPRRGRRARRPAARGPAERGPLQVHGRPCRPGRRAPRRPGDRRPDRSARDHPPARAPRPAGTARRVATADRPRAPRRRGRRRRDAVVRAQRARVRAPGPRVRRARRPLAARGPARAARRPRRGRARWPGPASGRPPAGAASAATSRRRSWRAPAGRPRRRWPRPSGPSCASARAWSVTWVWAALDVAIVLADAGAPELAARAIDEARAVLDDHHPGKLGQYHRARLLATRAWLDHEVGEPRGSVRRPRAMLGGGGAATPAAARAGALESAAAAPLGGAHNRGDRPHGRAPGARARRTGRRRVGRVHPPSRAEGPAAPRAPAALASNDPAVLERVAELEDDPDAEVAAAAPPPRRGSAPTAAAVAMLGGFGVTRAGWEIADDAWKRRVDARLVRVLLAEATPGDRGPDLRGPVGGRSAATARDGLHVAVSAARGVLDPPGAETSRMERGERTYRLWPERATVDARSSSTEATARSPPSAATRGRPRSSRPRAVDGGAAPGGALLGLGDGLPRAADGPAHRRADRARRASRARRRPRGAAELARGLVDMDPLNEGAHRALIVAYARAGRSGHALRQSRPCRRALVEELGVELGEETSDSRPRAGGRERLARSERR